MSKIYISVRGGNVDQILSTNSDDEVEVWDWDNIEAETEEDEDNDIEIEARLCGRRREYEVLSQKLYVIG